MKSGQSDNVRICEMIFRRNLSSFGANQHAEGATSRNSLASNGQSPALRALGPAGYTTTGSGSSRMPKRP